MNTERDTYNQIEYAHETGREEGRKEGKEEGIQEGRAEGRTCRRKDVQKVVKTNARKSR